MIDTNYLCPPSPPDESDRHSENSPLPSPQEKQVDRVAKRTFHFVDDSSKKRARSTRSQRIALSQKLKDLGDKSLSPHEKRKNLKSLFEMVEENWEVLDDRNISDFFKNLSYLGKGGNREMAISFLRGDFFRNILREKILDELKGFNRDALFTLIQTYLFFEIQEPRLFREILEIIKTQNHIKTCYHNQLSLIPCLLAHMKNKDINLLQMVSKELVARGLESFKPKGLSLTARAYAVLRYRDEFLLGRIAKAIEDGEIKLDQFDGQGLDVLIWSYAILEFGYVNLLAKLQERVRLLISREKGKREPLLKERNLCSIALSYTRFFLITAGGGDYRSFCKELVCEALERGNLDKKSINSLVQVGKFFKFEETSQLIQSTSLEKSYFEEDVHFHLERILASPDTIAFNEHCCGYFPDFRIGRLIIEADGPTHFVEVDGEKKPTLRTRLRDATYRVHGYRVISIPLHEWNRYLPEDKKQFLTKVLEDAGILPSPPRSWDLEEAIS